MARTRSRLARALLCLVSASILALVGVEAFVRHRYDPPLYLKGLPYDPLLGHRAVPHHSLGNSDADGRFTYALNSQGFRGPELPEGRAPDDVARLLFVGDSFLDGWLVREEDRMPASTAAALATRGVEAESFSVSCRGYGTYQELLLLREHGPRIHPDVVVLQAFPSNDLIDNTVELAGLTRMSAGEYVRPYALPRDDGSLRTTFVHPLRSFLRRHSRTFAVLEHAALARAASGPFDPIPTEAERIAAGDLPRESFELFRAGALEPTWETAWRRTEALLLAFRAEVEALGAELVVVVVPHKLQVQHDAARALLERRLAEAGRPSLDVSLDWNRPEERLAAFLTEAGIDHVMLLGPLRAAVEETGEPVYLADGHLDGRGHRLAGQLVAELLAPAGTESDDAPLPTAPAAALEALLPADGWVPFDSARHAAFLGEGMRWWSLDWGGDGGGWAMAPHCEIVLPPAPTPDTDLVLAGWIGHHAPVPLTVTVRFPGTSAPPVETRIDGTRHFEIPLPRAARPAAGPVHLRIGVDRPWPPHGGGPPLGFVLKGAGYR